MRVTPECDSINTINISSAPGIQALPEIAFGIDNYMVVWSDARIGNGYNIYGARITPAGTVLDPDGILIGPATETVQLEPSIAFSGSRFFVVWAYYSTPCAVNGRFVNSDGSLGDTVRIADIAEYSYRTSVAFDGTNFLVVWTQDPEMLKGQLVSTDGNLIGSPFTIATGVMTVISGALCFDGNSYMVTYTVRNGSVFEIWGRQYDTSGNPLDSAFIISNPANSSSTGHVAAGVNNYLFVWTHMGFPFDIYGNVDVATGIDTDDVDVPRETRYFATTIIRGPLILPVGKKCKVFDIIGREITTTNPAPGVYFIRVGTGIVQKVIKVQ